MDKIAKKEIIGQVKEYQNDRDYEYEDSILHLVSSAIQDSLIKNTDFKFNIEACNVYLGSYIYHLVQWITEIPDTYDAINNQKDFHWNFLEQSYTPIFFFTYKTEGLYSLTLSKTTLGEIENWKEEIINIIELKKVIDSARLVYYNYIKENLGSVLPEYLQLLDLSFD